MSMHFRLIRNKILRDRRIKERFFLRRNLCCYMLKNHLGTPFVPGVLYI